MPLIREHQGEPQVFIGRYGARVRKAPNFSSRLGKDELSNSAGSRDSRTT